MFQSWDEYAFLTVFVQSLAVDGVVLATKRSAVSYTAFRAFMDFTILPPSFNWRLAEGYCWLHPSIRIYEVFQQVGDFFGPSRS